MSQKRVTVTGQAALDIQKRRERAHGALDQILNGHDGLCLIVPLHPNWKAKEAEGIMRALNESFGSPGISEVLMVSDGDGDTAFFCAIARALGYEPLEAMCQGMRLWLQAHEDEITQREETTVSLPVGQA